MPKNTNKGKFVLPPPKNRIVVGANRWKKLDLKEDKQPGGTQSDEQGSPALKKESE